MWKKHAVKKILLLLGLIAIGGGAALFGAYRWWQWAGVSAVTRGERVAQKLGCFACHGPGAIRGILNPGSEVENVPSWDGGTVMMYVENEEEIREWILDGMPKRLKEEDHHHGEKEHGHPLIAMPAFRGKLSGQELDDLVAYFKAVSWFQAPSDSQARAGRDVAQKYGCFGCHGPEGRGNNPNPGSLKGYIPPWDGPDFPELVRDEAELREWILDGDIGRFRKNPLANAFIQRQKIKMPGYREVLSKKEIDQLVAYIGWLRENIKK